MQLEYNGTVLPNAWFTIQRREKRPRTRGGTGFRIGWHERWQIGGVLQEDSVSAMTTAIDALETTLATNGGDLIFYTDSGSTQSGHTLLNDDTIDGVRVMAGLNHPKGHPQGIWGSGIEYAGGGKVRRSYQVAFEADVYDPEGNLISYYETIRQTRSGGPKRRQLVSLTGQPQQQTLAAFTPVVVEQTGQAVGVHTYPTPQAPISPGLLLETPYLAERATADQFGGIRDVGLPVSWHYVMEGPPGALGLVTPIRPIII